MILSSLAIYSFTTNPLINLLLVVAIACVVIWAIIALLNWAGIGIPPPVRIILIALGCILAIILIFKAFAAVLAST